ncbi:uncharacterized protein JN550_004044 [Neoarthrinium moseri]|uniref:uncharacterized protein n=1 Tax=Neoarthrinium moseri TaxID=1658444 RepID=UPI001FDB6957|nr:uncharacterized protein JN550_004044 [Neoarthrinium moseri]KAI1872325.1 hypothetical protein JN550_004044 [Neoarthrinium moseri]
MPSVRSCALAALAGLSALVTVQGADLTGNTKNLFDESMTFLDKIYDSKAGYLRYFYYPLAASAHETRSSGWYATGLLQRNKGNDRQEAIKIIRNIIDGQHKDPKDEWYGDYQVYPEEPTVGTKAYPAVVYSTWDPNWRGFVGTTLMVIYEEFSHMLPCDLKDLMLESLYNDTVGDGYRNGGLVKGALNPSYTNPSVMRAVQASWVGRKMKDGNMTAYGEDYGSQIIDLFNMNNTLSEFNSAVYNGVSLYALTMWVKYLPADSILYQNGERMIKEIWTSLGQFYNANLKNLAGPWDRTYGYDMNEYFSILACYIWTMVGKEYAPVYDEPWTMAHADDFEYAPIIAVLAPFHDSLVPEDVKKKFRSFPGDHMVETAAFAPPGDAAVRNITSWVASNLTMGAMSFLDDPKNWDHSSQWNAAVTQWGRFDGSVGYFTLYPTVHALDSEVGQGWMNLTYPQGNSSSKFTFVLAPNPLGAKRDMNSLDDISGLNIKVSGSVNATPAITFCGLVGGSCSPKFGFEFWNVTFTMPNTPEGAAALPNIFLEIELEE